MNPLIQTALENIYISPLELCNLHCRLCYTNKTKNILSNAQILSFVKRYSTLLHKSYFLSLKSVLFCGGEVFTLKNFPRLVNNLTKKGVFISVITNGTQDRLKSIHRPQNCQLLVSFDGPEIIHDQNRGIGSYQKSLAFVRHALKLGFPVSIMFLITPESYPYRRSFPKILNKSLKNLYPANLTFTYITQKTRFYTQNHPLARRSISEDGLIPSQIINIKKNFSSVPANNFGCFQFSLQSNGLFYGCCESPNSIGSLRQPLSKTVFRFIQSLDPCTRCFLFKSQKSKVKSQLCSGCTDPQFLCGYKQELKKTGCREVVKSFNP